MTCWECRREEATKEITLKIDFVLQTVGVCDGCYEFYKGNSYKYLR